MTHFGIIGYPLHHSFSAQFFNEKFRTEHIDAEYSLYPMEQVCDLKTWFEAHHLKGINVTMPYKQTVIPLLTRLDETAEKIGAVNVVNREEDGSLVGYNTDAIGFYESIRPLLLPTDKKALILGTGGAAKAVRYGLEKLGLQATNVSRTPQAGQLGYDQISLQDYQVIVNCTPLGMVPDTEHLPPIAYEQLNSAQLLYDCIYNPTETLFLKEGKARGCRTMNGLEMLYGQAKAAWHIWN